MNEFGAMISDESLQRSAEGMWNPLYGTRGGSPDGGACLPKDTTAFIGFLREQGWDHWFLEATVEVNRRLAAKIPAPPNQVEDALGMPRRRDENKRTRQELVIAADKQALND